VLRKYTYLELVVALVASNSVELPPFPLAFLLADGVELAFAAVGIIEAGEGIEEEVSFDSEAAFSLAAAFSAFWASAVSRLT
jgi:hypothetical protein